MDARIVPVYKGACPNCGGPIEYHRLERRLPCARCLPDPPASSTVPEIARMLEDQGGLRGYAWLKTLHERYEDFELYFKTRKGYAPWSAQKSWAKRLLMGDSLAIIAPTGVGKSTLLTVYAAYRARRDGWKVLYIAPTENLVKQAAAALEELEPGMVAYYYSSMPAKVKDNMIHSIEGGEAPIIVVTTGFLQRRMDSLRKNAPFNLVIVDDVDSMVRNSRNIDRVLELMGYDRKVIDAASRIVDLRIKLYKALAQGNESKASKIEAKIVELEAMLRSFNPPNSQLIIASATGRPRGRKHLVFKELLGFEVGGSSDYLRNVLDSYIISDRIEDTVASVLGKLGPGGIVFVSQAHGRIYARRLAEYLASRGYRVALALSGGRRAVEKLARGDIDAIVGVASRYGVLVRGLDMPDKIRYAVFVDVPGALYSAWDLLASPRRLLRVLLYLGDLGDDTARQLADKVSRILDKVPEWSMIVAALNGNLKADGLLLEAVRIVEEARSYAYSRLYSMMGEGNRILIGSFVVEKHYGNLIVFIPDAPTYIQASGRTSRLYKGVMTFGLSVIVTGSIERVQALSERLKWYTSASIVEYDRVDLEDVKTRIEETRQGKGKRIDIKTVLMIVESPTKARTIAWFWGRPGKRLGIDRTRIYETSAVDEETGTIYLLTVTSSKGHVYDLTIDPGEGFYGVETGTVYKPIYDTVKRCLDCGTSYAGSGACPRCGSPRRLDSQATLSKLRKLALEVDEIVIATDPDREGEKIAWDLYLTLKPYNPNIYRGKFHEVTRRAVIEALRSPSGFSRPQVEAQIVRRITDRWIGFTLSSHLWARYNKRWLGAGRVQTPVLKWIVNRYAEWKATRGYWVRITLKNGAKLRIYAETRDKAERIASAGKATIAGLARLSEERGPQPPYTTDTLIYDASRRLRLSASATMKLAQDLFESGLITYHRTDSTRVSPAGINVAMEYMDRKGLKEYASPRSWGTGGAHEAIRPVKPYDAEELKRMILDGTLNVPVKLTWLHFRLYDMIFRRFIASHMKPAVIEYTDLTWMIADERITDRRISRITHPGWTLIADPGVEEWAARVEAGDVIAFAEVKIARGSKTPLFKSGDIVKLMKERGIGRPSTYSKAIEANKRHGYIIESKKVKVLVPTRTGIEVQRYLEFEFSDLVSEDTSRRLEEVLDSIEYGREAPSSVLDSLLERMTSIIKSGQSMGEAAI